MTLVTLQQAKEHYNAWLNAELKISHGQSYTIGSRSITRANLSEVRKQLDYWSNKVKELEIQSFGGRVARTKRFIPRDL